MKHRDQGLAVLFGLFILRVFVSTFMAFGHGIDKWPELLAAEVHFPDPLGISPRLSLALDFFSEFICPLFVLVGLRVRIAAFFPFMTMLVAGLVFHAQDPWQKKELALLYALPFLTILISGGGLFQVENLFRRVSRKSA